MSDSEHRNKGSWFWSMTKIVGLIATLMSIAYYLIQFGLVNPSRHEQPLTHTFSTELSGKLGLSAAENSAWHVAFANRKDCDAIRQYILSYPDGHFVASAQAILAARRPVTEVRWVAFEFPANVVASSSLEARTSRDAACNSAHAQLLRNMADGCSDFSRDSARYRSVIVDAPANTTCECDD